jgi:hypothetical protein
VNFYEHYMQSWQWAERRDVALAMADHACQVCNATKYLHVHHRTYARLGCEAKGDLTVLCEACHNAFHRRVGKDWDEMKKSKTRFVGCFGIDGLKECEGDPYQRKVLIAALRQMAKSKRIQP